MNTNTRKAIETWKEKWIAPHPNWRQPYGLECFARFIGCYGFRIHMGFGWERIHTLSFATSLQDNRKNSGNWKTLWKDRQYAR